jgi:Secretion system C-terminal sorting domain
MKKLFYLFFCSGIVCYMLTSATIINPSNPPASSTGAPGEGTCAQSGCHAPVNTALSGAVDISGVPDIVEPNTAYTITVKATTANINGKTTGFQLTCLDASDSKCGQMTGTTTVSVANSAGREYARQSKNTSYTSNAATWTFTWKSPASLPKSTITFYAASVIGNGNGKENSDFTVTKTKVVNLKSTATIDAILDAAVKVFPNPVSETLNIEVTSSEKNIEGYLLDAAGRQVKKMYLEASNQINVSNMAKGNYLLEIRAGEKHTVKKITLQ